MTAFCVPTASIEWQSRPTAKVSSTSAARLACDRCHAWMGMTYSATPEQIFLNHSTVDFRGMSRDGMAAFAPTYHIFVADKAPWWHIDDTLKQFPGDNEVERTPTGKEAAAHTEETGQT